MDKILEESVQQLKDAGLSLSEIAEQLGLSIDELTPKIEPIAASTIADAYSKEDSIQVLTQSLGISKSTLYRKLQESNAPLKRELEADNREVRNQEIADRYSRGVLVADIANEFGLSTTAINNILRRLNVPRRR